MTFQVLVRGTIRLDRERNAYFESNVIDHVLIDRAKARVPNIPNSTKDLLWEKVWLTALINSYAFSETSYINEQKGLCKKDDFWKLHVLSLVLLNLREIPFERIFCSRRFPIRKGNSWKTKTLSHFKRGNLQSLKLIGVQDIEALCYFYFNDELNQWQWNVDSYYDTVWRLCYLCPFLF